MGVPEWGVYEELFNSDEERFGGSGVTNVGKLKCQDEPWKVASSPSSCASRRWPA